MRYTDLAPTRFEEVDALAKRPMRQPCRSRSRPAEDRRPSCVRDPAGGAGACPEAVERLAALMRSNDERVSLAACVAIIERGYGKPEQRSDSAVVHKFAVVPEEAEWLERRG
jgi:hypothetical protein